MSHIHKPYSTTPSHLHKPYSTSHLHKPYSTSHLHKPYSTCHLHKPYFTSHLHKPYSTSHLHNPIPPPPQKHVPKRDMADQPMAAVHDDRQFGGPTVFGARVRRAGDRSPTARRRLGAADARLVSPLRTHSRNVRRVRRRDVRRVSVQETPAPAYAALL